jgi:hypothetical protein
MPIDDDRDHLEEFNEVLERYEERRRRPISGQHQSPQRLPSLQFVRQTVPETACQRGRND